MTSEKNEVRTIVRHGWVYTLANVVNRVAGLLLLPLYTTLLTPSEFGVYALVAVVGDILAVMMMIGANNAFTVVYFEEEEGAGRRRLVSTVFLALSVVALALAALAYPAGLAISGALFGDRAEAVTVALALAGIGLGTVFELALAYWRVQKRSMACLGASLAKAVVLLGFSGLFLLVLDLKVEGIFLANVAAFALLGGGLVVAILAINGLGFSGALLKRVVRLGLPFMPQALFDIANQFVARALLNLLIGTAAVGLFAFGMRLASLLYMLLTASFLQIWSVRRFEERGGVDPSARGAARGPADVVFHLFLVALAAAGLGLTLLAPEILWLIASPRYAPVLSSMPLLVLAYALHGARMNPEVALMKSKRTGTLPLISAASLAVGTVLAVALISPYGVFGAALANLGREVFQILLTEGVRRRVAPEEGRLAWGRVAGVLVPAAAVWAVGWLAFADQLVPGLVPAVVVAKLGLVLVFVALAAFGPGLGREGRGALGDLFARRVPVA